VKDLPLLMPRLQEYSKNADEVGFKAFEANLMWPNEIFDKFHDGLKKTPEEIEAMNKKK